MIATCKEWVIYTQMCFLLSEMCGDLDNLDLGDTVEYSLSKGKGNKVSAEKVTKVAAGTRSFHLFMTFFFKRTVFLFV